MVLYRKYRPQTLDQIVGQDSVKQTLKSAIAAGKLAHAYLFCGPRGTGKTSTARILAKIVNCERSTAAEVGGRKTDVLPCNKCSSCLSITDGSSLDLVEMDAASNRGIEDIRSLRDNIKLAPSNSFKKVYIIDEVHMLTGEAFNALLKTLEEPPSHVLFILATTDAQKIPQTVLSRVQRLEFKPATTKEQVEALKRVVEEEGLKVDEESLLLLAGRAQGSFRDGVKFLDQLSSFKKIDRSIVEEHLGVGEFKGLIELVTSLSAKDSLKSLGVLMAQFEKGVNPKELNLSILSLLRQILLTKNGLGDMVLKEMGDEKFEEIKSLAAEFSTVQALKLIDNFHTSLEQLRFVTIPTLPLEVAVITSCLEEGKIESQVSRAPVLEVKDEVEVGKPEPKIESADIQKIQEKWRYVLETVRQHNFSLEALLRTAKIIECGKSGVIFEVPYSFHQRILEAPKSRDILESILSDILSRPVKVSTVLGRRPMVRDELINIEVAADDEIVRIASEIFSSETIN